MGIQASVPQEQVIYTNDFENASNPLTEWSSQQVDRTPSGRGFLGQFLNQTVSLSLDDLPAHSEIVISFDLYLIESWDGNATYPVPGQGNVPAGPDVWDLSVEGGPNLIHTTFANVIDQSGATDQAYPDEFPGGHHPSRTGATESNTLGYGAYGDTVYSLRFEFPDVSDAVKFLFSASGLQTLPGDENWGLDNVQVQTVGSGLPAWTVYLDQNHNSQLDPGEISTTTDSNGNYSFRNLSPGSYTVAEVPQLGWVQTAPESGTYSVMLGTGQVVTGINFANQPSIGPPVNHPPRFGTAPPTATSVGQLLRYDAHATDPDLDPLTYDLVVKPDGMTVDTTTGTVVWTPTPNEVGSQDVVLRVQDGKGGIDLQSFKILVSHANINPARKMIMEHEGLVVSGGVFIVTGRGAVLYRVWSGIVGSKESSDGHRVTRWTL